MAVSVDTRNAGTNTAGATSISWSHTINTGSNLHLTVNVGTGSGSVITPSGVLWDSGGANTALTNTVNSIAANQADALNNIQASLWVLVNPATGTKTIKVSVGTSCEITSGSESQFGVNQSSPYNGASPQKWQTGANTNISHSVTSATGELVIDSNGINDSGGSTTPVKGASQTQISNHDNGANTSAGMASDQPGAATVTVAWTGMTTTVADSCSVAISLAAAGAATDTNEWHFNQPPRRVATSTLMY